MKDKRALSLLVDVAPGQLPGRAAAGGRQAESPASPASAATLTCGPTGPGGVPRPRGFHTESTVETPGPADRGARRAVAGQDGDFCDSDHNAHSSRINR